MDSKRGKNWSWLPAHMPAVAKLLAEKREQVGAEWVNTCWRNGVVEAQPGWFFAAEGALAVGTPWPEAPGIELWLGLREAQKLPSLLVMRDKGAAANAAD